jgi:hypothetical protein
MEKPKISWIGRVRRIIKPPLPGVPEKAEITVHGADDLYRELRIENALVDKNGKTRKLREDVDVVLTIEADLTSTIPNDEEIL